jgi:hypothetical protein
MQVVIRIQPLFCLPLPSFEGFPGVFGVPDGSRGPGSFQMNEAAVTMSVDLSTSGEKQ